MQAKKKWQNPELIVLVRGKPEEAVLTACKGELAGPANDNVACIGGAAACIECSAIGAS